MDRQGDSGGDEASPWAGAMTTTTTCLERLDEVAATMERCWGIDRLPLLVDPGLRLRFDRQRAKLERPSPPIMPRLSSSRPRA